MITRYLKEFELVTFFSNLSICNKSSMFDDMKCKWKNMLIIKVHIHDGLSIISPKKIINESIIYLLFARVYLINDKL